LTKRIAPKERDAARIAARSPQASKSAARGVSLAPISFGELIDKITILKIKAQRIHDPAKASNIRNELQLLTEARAHFSTGVRRNRSAGSEARAHHFLAQHCAWNHRRSCRWVLACLTEGEIAIVLSDNVV
jgi:hypothetical protein